MSTWLWAGVLVVAAWAAHWGADQLLTPLKMLRNNGDSPLRQELPFWRL
jgi:hypothetical protein